MIYAIHFQEYMAIGIALMAVTGWLFAFFDKRKMYIAGQTISWFPFVFSWVYLILVAPELEFMMRSIEFELFFSNPALINYLLIASLMAPVIVSKAGKRTLGIAYITYGGLLALSMPWSIPRPIVLAVTFVTASSLITMGAVTENNYLKTVNIDKKVLSIIREKGAVSTEDMMKALELPDYEVKEILFRLWEIGMVDYDSRNDRYGPVGYFEKRKSTQKT